jgi:hypothetical protein
MDLRCDGCGMVRDTAEGSPCADAVCSGTFRRTNEARGSDGSLGAPAAMAALLGLVALVIKVLMVIVGRP